MAALETISYYYGLEFDIFTPDLVDPEGQDTGVEERDSTYFVNHK